MAAHGMSVVEVRRDAAGAGRRCATAASTAASPPRRRCAISGPAAGHPRLRTSADPEGRARARHAQQLRRRQHALGHGPDGARRTSTSTSAARPPETGEQAAAYKRYGITRGRPATPGAGFEPRFDLDQEPNEPNRFGWVVEFDPYDPGSVPVKRTALGRFKHEGCTHAVCAGRPRRLLQRRRRALRVRLQIRHRPPLEPAGPRRQPRPAGRGHAASSRASRRTARCAGCRWSMAQGPLTAANGFASQADVLIEARRAADLLGATPMDRPEDVETNPVNGRVYVMLTNNVRRTAEQVNPANPRPRNIHGHVLEIIPPGAGSREVDHAAAEARWEIFLAGGKPGVGPRRAVPPRHQRRRLALLPRQLRLRQPGPHLDLDRWRGRCRRRRRRALCRRHGGARQGADPAVLPGADRRRGLRPPLHAGRHHAVPGDPASRPRTPAAPSTTPPPAGPISGRNAAAAERHRHHPAGRRTDRLTRAAGPCLRVFPNFIGLDARPRRSRHDPRPDSHRGWMAGRNGCPASDAESGRGRQYAALPFAEREGEFRSCWSPAAKRAAGCCPRAGRRSASRRMSWRPRRPSRRRASSARWCRSRSAATPT